MSYIFKMNTYVHSSGSSFFLLVILFHYLVHFLYCHTFPRGENLLQYKFNADSHYYNRISSTSWEEHKIFAL